MIVTIPDKRDGDQINSREQLIPRRIKILIPGIIIAFFATLVIFNHALSNIVTGRIQIVSIIIGIMVIYFFTYMLLQNFKNLKMLKLYIDDKSADAK